jgi:ribosomal peptide maturation radical SAM protein 1
MKNKERNVSRNNINFLDEETPEKRKEILEKKPQVLLVSMPFGPLFLPSIGLGLLKAALSSHTISGKTLYFTLQFAELIGVPLYLQIACEKPVTDLIGEWIFSGSLFDSDSLDVEGYIEAILRDRFPDQRKRHINKLIKISDIDREKFIQDVINVRSKVESFLENCLKEIITYNSRIIAFTSIFQQQVAALALAKRIKAQAPETFIIFGGANCEGIMGIEVIRQFPFVDAVVSGEGDIVFPALVQCVLEKKNFSNLQGVYSRDTITLASSKGQYLNATSVSEMDCLPFPDYDDFFEQYEASSLKFNEQHQVQLLLETSRGCWWGEKSQCTFCGLNGSSINYRSKSAQRALDELICLTNKYPNYSVSFVDNILNLKYFKEFIPELAARQLNLELFYEVKANLRKDQIRLLRDAGIKAIQPGIESFSDRVLELMRKGVKSLQNIQLLKWCKELGVTPWWNMLWGFPGEPPEEYDCIAALIPFLMHFQPPSLAATVRLDRFSLNFNYSEQIGFVKVTPYPSYYYVYPLPHEAVANLAYYFTFEYSQPQDVLSYTQPVVEQIIFWKEKYKTSDLFSVDKGTHLLIWDLRPIAHKPLEILTGLQKNLYVACDRIYTMNQIRQLVERITGTVTSPQEIEDLLQPLVNCGLMIRNHDTYLSLAIPLGDYSPGRAVIEHFLEKVKTFGKPLGDEVIIPMKQSLRTTFPGRAQKQVNLNSSSITLTSNDFYFNEQGDLLINCNEITKRLGNGQLNGGKRE